MRSHPSLLIGSTALGWQEFGDVAQLGSMTRAMPGGDGSLSFTIPGSVAGQRRNVLRAGAECILRLPGDTWGGLLVGDPMAGFVRSQPRIEAAASGLWAHAARRRDIAYVWSDMDPGQWFRLREVYDSSDPDLLVEMIDQGKFAVDTDGRLFIRGDSDRTFTGYATARLAYWLDKGLVDLGCRIVGLDLYYKSNFPTDWRMTARSMDGTPWDCSKSGTLEESDTTTRSSWRTLEIDLTQPSTSLALALNLNSGSAASPATDPWIKVKVVIVRCRMDGASVDRTVKLYNAMADIATLTGLATTTRVTTWSPVTVLHHLAFRPDEERSAADLLRELASMHDQPLEHFFDYADGAWRFTLNELPATVDPTRNRHWVLSDSRAGEDSSGVVRDYEAMPEYVRLHHLSYDVDDMPPGHPRSTCYPSEPTSTTDSVIVDTSHADQLMDDATALATAERIYDQLAAASFSGSALFGPTALTTTGQELPSYLIRPGDRVNIPGREGASDIYVRETSYNFASQRMTAGLGWPFDKLPTAAAARVYRPVLGRGRKWNLGR